MCLPASCLPAFKEINWASIAKAVHDPVVKSCSRVPIARITSAFSAIEFALSDPVTPIGPILRECSLVRFARPAIVSTTGIWCFSAKFFSCSVALEY